MSAVKKTVLDTVDDLVSDLLYYDRKEDEELPRGEIERMVRSGEITEAEIVEQFRRSLRAGLG